MNEEFLKEYTAALERATDTMMAMQKKGVLIEGVDDQLIRNNDLAQAEVKRLSDQLTSMNQK